MAVSRFATRANDPGATAARRIQHGAKSAILKGHANMQTIEEMERRAYAAGNTTLADAYGRVIDLENHAAELRALVREAVDFIPNPEHADRITDALERLEDAAP
jgi:3-keto-L-gulonate-6-phosphate decarboxylase